MIQDIGDKLTRKTATKSEIGGDTVIAAVWFAFYLIAIATAITAPLFTSAINFASRLLPAG